MKVLRWPRRHPVPVGVAATAAAAAVSIAAGITVLLTTGPTTHSPVGTAAAGAQRASSVTTGSAWLASADGRRLTLIVAELSKVSVAEAAGRKSAARTAGERLAADAASALTGTPPPTNPAVYRSALRDLSAAGSAAAAGQFGQRAARLLLAGETGIMQVTAAADLPVAGRTSGSTAVTPTGRY